MREVLGQQGIVEDIVPAPRHNRRVAVARPRGRLPRSMPDQLVTTNGSFKEDAYDRYGLVPIHPDTAIRSVPIANRFGISAQGSCRIAPRSSRANQLWLGRHRQNEQLMGVLLSLRRHQDDDVPTAAEAMVTDSCPGVSDGVHDHGRRGRSRGNRNALSSLLWR